MKRTSWSTGLSVSGDGVGVVAHAGSVALRLLADRTGLTAELTEAMARRSFLPVHDRGRVLIDVAVMLADGGEAIADINVLRHQSSALGPVASPPTVWRTLNEVTGGRLKKIAAARARVRRHVWTQLLRAPAEAAGYALQPASTQPRTVRALSEALSLDALPTAGHVVAVDLEQVTLDLASVPLDEVLDFRRQHGAEHRAYARDLRHFVRDLAGLDQDARDRAFIDRREALADTADHLQRLARTSWRRPLASFGLGIAGSAVTLAYGNPIGAGLTAAGALLGLRRQADPASAYTYLFQAQAHLSADRRHA